MMGDYKQGDAITYTGKGFLGFDKSDRNATFVSFYGENDAEIMYKSRKVLVFLHEIVATKTSKSK